MPSAQNWTFCRAFSPLDVAHVSKGGAPRFARVRYSTRIAERNAGSRPGASGLCCATTLLPYPRVARGAGRLPSPGSSAGCWGTLWRLGPPAMTGSPRSPPTSLGAGALAWAAGWTPLPHAVPFGPSRLPYVCALSRSDCAPLACESGTTRVVPRSRSTTATTASS